MSSPLISTTSAVSSRTAWRPVCVDTENGREAKEEDEEKRVARLAQLCIRSRQNINLWLK